MKLKQRKKSVVKHEKVPIKMVGNALLQLKRRVHKTNENELIN